MAENDIYNSEIHYQNIVSKLLKGVYCKPGKSKYRILNSANLRHFKRLIAKFDSEDISFIRRIQYIKALKKTASLTHKDLKDLAREDVEKIIASLNKVHKSLTSRRDYVNYNKFIWKMLFPELDSKGRADDTMVPHPWRVKVNNDKSLQKRRSDKIDDTEYIKIIRGFSQDPRMQTWFALLYECLARPQELCYLNIGNVHMEDRYYRLDIAEHGKEGPKELQAIDGYGYLADWLNKHPLRDNKAAPLFITLGNRNGKYRRLTPKHANNMLHIKLKELGIDKPLTNYSFKRNGVTARVLQGQSPQMIQQIAKWTTVNQLKTYDLSDQRDVFKQELMDRGILPPDGSVKGKVSFKFCTFCNTVNPKNNSNCSQCKRPLDREEILKAELEKEQMLTEIKAQNKRLEKKFDLAISVLSTQLGEFRQKKDTASRKIAALEKELAELQKNG